MLSSSSTMSSSSAFSSYQNQNQSQTGVPSSNPLSGTTMVRCCGDEPSASYAAVSNPSFIDKRSRFVDIVLFVCGLGPQGASVSTSGYVSFICLQLHALIEDEDDYAVIQSNAKLLYHTYFILLGNIRANKTITFDRR